MKRLMTTLLVLTLVAASQAAWAISEQEQTMQDATAVLNDFVNIPENAIPPALLSQAYGIAVIPSVIKAGFIVGGRYGEGIMSVRTADGSWSHPVFIDLAGASLGWQIGAASSDIILVFKTQRGVDQIVNGQVTLGADVSVAAGPVGRSASASTNLRMDAEIYSYSRSRGLFAGLALEGGVITIDAEADWRYYGDMIDSSTILHRNDRGSLPATAQRLVYTLNQYMPSINGSGGPIPYGDTGSTGGQYGNGQAQPYNNGQAQPYNGGQAQPYTNDQSQPYNSGQSQPYNSGQAQPYNSGQAQPYSNGQTQQYNSGQVQPYSSGQTQPYNSGQTQPYNSGQTQPYSSGQTQSYDNNGQTQTYSNGSGAGY